MSDQEIWKPIPSLPSYEASSLGRIRSLDRPVNLRGPKPHTQVRKGCIMSPGRSSSGYLSIRSPGSRKTVYVHALVMEAFMGKRPANMVCDHIDSDPRNNAVGNLRYVNKSVNSLNRKGAKGVQNKKHGSYQSIIKHNGHNICLGVYKTKAKAEAVTAQIRAILIGKEVAKSEAQNLRSELEQARRERDEARGQRDVAQVDLDCAREETAEAIARAERAKADAKASAATNAYACQQRDAAIARAECAEARAAKAERERDEARASQALTQKAREDDRDRLQQKCSDWEVYWRASDSHGVGLTKDQAVELLQDALGVEVEIKDHHRAAAEKLAGLLEDALDECLGNTVLVENIKAALAEWRKGGGE